MEKLVELIQASTTYPVSIGAMPSNESIVIYLQGGLTQDTFLNKGMVYESNLEVMGKSADAEALSSAMWAIHRDLTTAMSYPYGTDWAIQDIQSRTTPFYSTREQNKQWIYGSSLRVRWSK